MALREVFDVFWLDILNISFIHHAVGDVPSGDQVSKPLGGEFIVLVVVSRHVRFIFRLRGCISRQQPGR